MENGSTLSGGMLWSATVERGTGFNADAFKEKP